MSFDWAVFWETVKADAGFIIPLLIVFNVVTLIVARRRRKDDRKWYESED